MFSDCIAIFEVSVFLEKQFLLLSVIFLRKHQPFFNTLYCIKSSLQIGKYNQVGKKLKFFLRVDFLCYSLKNKTNSIKTKTFQNQNFKTKTNVKTKTSKPKPMSKPKPQNQNHTKTKTIKTKPFGFGACLDIG
jgi:predicted nucleotide-binding protein (sugar kinase/HSP70/actin superfamily)